MNGMNVSSLRLGEARFLTLKAAPSGFLISQRHLAGLDRLGRFGPTKINLCVGAKHASPSPAQPMEPKFLETVFLKPTGNPS
jgi:hypothetical protein